MCALRALLWDRRTSTLNVRLLLIKNNTLLKHSSFRFEVLFHYFGHFEVENDQNCNCFKAPEENWIKHCAIALLQSTWVLGSGT